MGFREEIRAWGVGMMVGVLRQSFQPMNILYLMRFLATVMAS